MSALRPTVSRDDLFRVCTRAPVHGQWTTHARSRLDDRRRIKSLPREVGSGIVGGVSVHVDDAPCAWISGHPQRGHDAVYRHLCARKNSGAIGTNDGLYPFSRPFERPDDPRGLDGKPIVPSPHWRRRTQQGDERPSSRAHAPFHRHPRTATLQWRRQPSTMTLCRHLRLGVWAQLRLHMDVPPSRAGCPLASLPESFYCIYTPWRLLVCSGIPCRCEFRANVWPGFEDGDELVFSSPEGEVVQQTDGRIGPPWNVQGRLVGRKYGSARGRSFWVVVIVKNDEGFRCCRGGVRVDENGWSVSLWARGHWHGARPRTMTPRRCTFWRAWDCMGNARIPAASRIKERTAGVAPFLPQFCKEGPQHEHERGVARDDGFKAGQRFRECRFRNLPPCHVSPHPPGRARWRRGK